MTSQFTTTDINFQDQTALQQRLINFPEEDRFNEINAILDRNVIEGSIPWRYRSSRSSTLR
jgi:hypothetical protein